MTHFGFVTFGSIALLLLLAWAVAIWRNRRTIGKYDGTGNPAAGIIVFVEPVRWLFVIWGFIGFCRGLRQAALEHRIILFRWSHVAGSLLVIPDLMRRGRLDAKAARLNRFLHELHRDYPESTIHLVGYSSGVYLVFEAVKKVSHCNLGWVIAIHGTVSARYQMNDILASCRVLNVHGANDWLINGIGPLLFGTNDRKHGPACGMVGLCCTDHRLVQRSWCLTDIRDGYFGDHFTAMSSGWVRRHVAPLLSVTDSPQSHR